MTNAQEPASENFKEAASFIESSERILLIAHRRPDGDSLGACSALALALRQFGAKTALACIDEIPKRLRFIPETEKFVKEFDLSDFDLIIINDAGAHHMTGFHNKYSDFLSKKIPIINIDHHASNEGFGTVNIIDTHASSTTMIVWKLLKYLPVKITKEMAFCLLTGIYADTGSFIHSNTTKETFEIAGEIAKLGIQITDIAKPLFKEATFAQLKLWGFILENLQRNEKQIYSSIVTDKDFRSIGAHSSDTGGIVDLMNTIPDAAFTILLAENDGEVKGSLRTQRDDVNVSDIASQFGGGGHKKASGFRIHGRIEKRMVWKIVPEEK